MSNPSWVKGGTSPNPAGRRIYKALSDAIRIELQSDDAKPRAIAQRLVSMAMHDEDPKVCLAATSLLLDRMEGKATQSIDVAIEHNVTLSADERRARLAELMGKRAELELTAVESTP